MHPRSHFPLTQAAAALLLLASAGVTQDWVQPFPSTTPTVREAPSLCFDVARNQTVMFGGAKDGSVTGGLQDTWTWDGTNWTQQNPMTVPPTRAWAPMSYDLARGVVVMFGGRIHGGPAGPTGVMNDLWEWNGTDWKQITTTNPPAARYGGTMAYDVARGVHVLFSGVNGSNVSFDETWEYNGFTQTWTQLMPATSPGGRVYAGLAYDQARNKTVLYGGADDTFTIKPNVFWEWNGTNWTAVTPATDPGPVQGHVMVYDSIRQRVVIQGGQNSSRAYRVGTWEYDGRHTYWFNAETNPARGNWLAGAAFDFIRARMVVFGGYSSSGILGTTWERDPGLPGFSVFGVGCGTPAPTLAVTSLPSLGGTFSLDVRNLPSPAAVSVLFGVSNKTWGSVALPLNLGLIGLPSCSLYTSIDISTSVPSSGGTATWSVPIPNNPSLSGFAFYNQALSTSSSGLGLSNASESTIR